jgi:hypothetical protein
MGGGAAERLARWGLIPPKYPPPPTAAGKSIVLVSTLLESVTAEGDIRDVANKLSGFIVYRLMHWTRLCRVLTTI